MEKHCNVCGTKLMKTNWGNYYCPNCGKLEENQDREQETKETPSYIG